MVIDRRDGSRDLYPLLQATRQIRDLELGELGYGDVQITGRGPEDCPVLVGVEYKKLGDLCQSIDNGRLVGHQLPGMLECYQDVWLLVEGIWREGADGEVEVPRGSSWSPLRSGNGPFTATALQSFLLTMQIKLQIKVMQTGTSRQTVQWLLAMNRWWTGKAYEEHRAHLAFDNSQALSLISRPTILRRVAKELPGIGWDRSGVVARHFSSVVDMVNAPEAEWLEIKGIGKGIARNVVKALEGEETQ